MSGVCERACECVSSSAWVLANVSARADKICEGCLLSLQEREREREERYETSGRGTKVQRLAVSTAVINFQLRNRESQNATTTLRAANDERSFCRVDEISAIKAAVTCYVKVVN